MQGRDTVSTNSPPGLVERLAFLLMTLLLALCAVATLMVATSGQLPILNQSFALQHAINLGVIGLCGMLIALLLAGIFKPRFVWVSRCAALLVLFLLALELELRVFDKFAISVDHSLVDIASRVVEADGVEIFLPQSKPGSPLGFRWEHDEPVKKTGYRVLMIGNSFVYGSGKTFPNNYPQALERILRQHYPDRNVTVMPAGVNGHGVVEELALYRYLIKKGYNFDGVVLSYTTSTDPSQNQPDTVLTVIAGQKQRLHDNVFLRAFYPLNYYMARYLIYFRSMSQKVDAPVADTGGPRDADGCPPNPTFDASTRERINYYYVGKDHKDVPIDTSLNALLTLGQEAQANKQKFATILLPDRNAVLAGSRARFAGKTMDWDWVRTDIKERIGGRWPVVDFTDPYINRPDMFMCGDGHWSDKGNREGARLAADVIAPWFR